MIPYFRKSLLAGLLCLLVASVSEAQTLRASSLVRPTKLTLSGKKIYCDFGADKVTPVHAKRVSGQMQVSALRKAQLRIAKSKKVCPSRCTVSLKAAKRSGVTSRARSLRFKFAAADSCKLPLSVTVERSPEGGSLSLSRSRVLYVPRPNYSGTDRFSLKVSNTRGNSTVKSFSVRVAGPACRLTSVLPAGRVTVTESEPTEILLAQESCGLPVTTEIIRSPVHGSADSAGSRIIYSPAHHYVGTDSLSVRAISSRGAELTLEVPISVMKGSESFAGVKDSLAPYRERITRTEALALLKRVGLGDRRLLADFPENQPIDRAQFIEHVINFDPGAAVEEESENIGLHASNWKNFPTVSQGGWFWETWTARNAWSYQVFHGNPLREVMFINLHDHFAANLQVSREPDQIGLAWAVRDHYYKLHAHSLGSIEEFLKLMNYDVAMSWFLDNHLNHYNPAASGRYQSRLGNFNYGREMLERFTLGRADPYSGAPLYTEADVNASARILSGFFSWFPTYSSAQPGFQGWNIGCATSDGNCEGMGVGFDPAVAYDGDIDIFKGGLMDGVAVPPLAGGSHTFNVRALGGSAGGRSPAADSFMDVLLYDHPATARHLAYSFFGRIAYPHPAESVTGELAQLLVSTNYDIKSFLRRVLNSSAMFTNDTFNSCIKSPAEHLAYALKTLGAPMTKHFSIDIFVGAMSAAGQVIFEAPTVFGWGLCGDPVKPGVANHGEAWLTYQGLLNRGRYLWKLLTEQQRTAPYTRWYYLHPSVTEAGEGMDIESLLSGSIGTAAPGELVANALERYQISLSSEQQAMLVEYLDGQRGFSGSQPAWADATEAQRMERIRGLVWIVSMHPRSFM